MSFYQTILRKVPRRYLIRLSYVFTKFSPLLFKGNNVECPVCGQHFRKFLPYGVHQKREGVLCPKCLSLERHRLMWLFLKRETDFFAAPKKVLHVAPEQCFLERFKKAKNLQYTTADIESPIADVKMDIQKMPFENEIFDVIICNHVLEHVEDDHKAMSEIFRVLKTGGFAILQVPIDFSRSVTYEDSTITSPQEREKHFWQKDHLRLYAPDFIERLQAVGFQLKQNNFTEKLTEYEIQRFRLPEKELMYAFWKL